MLFAVQRLKKHIISSLFELSAFSESFPLSLRRRSEKKLKRKPYLGLFLIFALSFQFVFQAEANSITVDELLKQECQKAAKAETGKELEVQALTNCVTKTTNKIKKIMDEVKSGSQALIKKYDIKDSTIESSSKDKKEEDKSIDSGPMIVKLKEDCQQEKQSAEECCSNPNSCNGIALDLAQHVLPLAPALFGAYKSYTISRDASKGNLTHQEAVNKLCNAQNTASIGAFAGGLLNQLSPLFQKTCGKEIKKCRSACNDKVDEFKKDFRAVYSRLFPKKDIYSMIKHSRECLDFSKDLKDDIEFDNNGNFKKEKRKNTCYFAVNEGFKKTTKADNTDYLNQHTALAWLLYVAKAYKNTTKSQVSLLSNKSNEKEVVDCGHQPNRMLAPSSRPSGPVPPPAIQLCQKAVDYAVNNTAPPPMPGNNSSNNPGNIQQVGSLAGNTQGSRLSSLQAPSGDECQYGVMDSAKLEECDTLDVGDDEFDVNKKPDLAKNNLPSWQKGGGGSSSSGGGGGGPGGGVGGLAGDEPSGGTEGSYPYYGDMSGNSNFSSEGGGYEPSAYPGSNPDNPPYRKVAENSEDMPLDRTEQAFLDEEETDGERSIFQIASERIQHFCGDYSCDK